MDPYLALWGYKNSTPVLYADSMSWFWKWTENDAHKAKTIITELDHVDFVEGSKILDRLKPDQRQLIAHVISNKVLTQGEPHHVPGLLTKARNVGSMIDLHFRKKTKRDTLLISLSGGVSPATSLAAAIRYANLVILLVQPLLTQRTVDWKRVVITGNPSVIANLKSCPKPFQAVALSQKAFLQELNRASTVLVPCGFTTVYESLAYGAPLMFLPENHNGHLYEYLTITKGVTGLSKKEKIFPHTFFGLAGVNLKNIRTLEYSMKRIKHSIDLFFSSPSFRDAKNNQIQAWLHALQNPRSLYRSQKKQIRLTIPTFSGAERVAQEATLFL
jgi:hypothetical protein